MFQTRYVQSMHAKFSSSAQTVSCCHGKSSTDDACANRINNNNKTILRSRNQQTNKRHKKGHSPTRAREICPKFPAFQRSMSLSPSALFARSSSRSAIRSIIIRTNCTRAVWHLFRAGASFFFGGMG